MKINASAAIAKSIASQFTITELEAFFLDYAVGLKNIRFNAGSIQVTLNGSKEQIRDAIKTLYTGEHNKNQSSKELPIELQNLAKTLTNKFSYQEQFDNMADEYIRSCAINGIEPHPEVFSDLDSDQQ